MAFDGSVMQAQLCGTVARRARHGVVAAVASACIVAGCGGDDDGSGARMSASRRHGSAQRSQTSARCLVCCTCRRRARTAVPGGGPSSNPCKTLEYARSRWPARPAAVTKRDAATWPVSGQRNHRHAGRPACTAAAASPVSPIASTVASSWPARPRPAGPRAGAERHVWRSLDLERGGHRPRRSRERQRQRRDDDRQRRQRHVASDRARRGQGRIGRQLAAGWKYERPACFTPGGVASDSLWGQVDLVSLNWVAGIGAPAPRLHHPPPSPLCPAKCRGRAAGRRIDRAAARELECRQQRSRQVQPHPRRRGRRGRRGQSGLSQSDVGVTSGGAGGNGPSIGIAVVNSPAGVSSDFAYTYASAGAHRVLAAPVSTPADARATAARRRVRRQRAGTYLHAAEHFGARPVAGEWPIAVLARPWNQVHFSEGRQPVPLLQARCDGARTRLRRGSPR